MASIGSDTHILAIDRRTKMLRIPKWEILFICAVAFALLVADRQIRLSMVLNEGFNNYTQQCGNGMAPCKVGSVCANGFCISVNLKEMPINPLPVYP